MTHNRRWCGADRPLLVHIVDVQRARVGNGVGRNLAVAHYEAVVAIPQHNAVPVGLVHEDHRELILRVADDDVDEIDAAALKLGAHAAPVVVGAGHADILRAEAETRTGAHGRRHLAAAEDELPLDLRLGKRSGRLRIAWQEVHEIDGIRADAHDIPLAARLEWNRRGFVRHRGGV